MNARPEPRLRRRSILRGAGIALTLPALPSLLRSREARAQADTRQCLVVIGHPNGTTQNAGSAEVPEGLLERLDPVAGKYTVVRNINNDPVKLGQYDTDTVTAHTAGFSGFLAGEAMPAIGQELITFDQRLAALPEHQGSRASSLAINIGKRPDSQSGVPQSWFNHWSWQGPMQPTPTYHDPRKLFEDLFTDFTPEEDPAVRARLERRRALLDGVLDQIHDLEPKLGNDDRVRLDQYLNAVDELDTKTKLLLDGGLALQCEVGNEPDAVVDGITPPTDLYPDVLAAMQQLVVLALQCDASRIVTFLHASPAGGGSVTQMPFVPGLEGSVSGWHPLSHWSAPYGNLSSDTALNRRDFERVLAWHYDRVVDFVNALDAVPTADGGTLLDQTLVCFGSWLDAALHRAGNVYQVLFGRGGGAFDVGQPLLEANPGNDKGPRNIGDLWLTVMRGFGVDLDSVGEGNSSIDELLV